MKSFPKISREDSDILVEMNGQQKRFQQVALPQSFIDWQLSERKQMFQHLQNRERPFFFAPHLPTLITRSGENTEFCLNAASKGVGMVPVDEEIHHITREMTDAVKNLNIKDPGSMLQPRVNAALLLYGDSEKINRFCLGGLEIFETQSFLNMMNDPRVSLFFVGNAPSYKSYQIDCIAEIIEPQHIFYQFVSAMRSLFEQENFHYQQPCYPYAIKYHVIQVFDKSLKVRDV
jgi:hypothetical protein